MPIVPVVCTPDGGSGCCPELPAGDRGAQSGMIGFEYNGSAYAIGAVTPVAMDTVYTDPTTSVSAPIADGDSVETADYTFTRGTPANGCSIFTKGAGDYIIQVLLSVDAPLAFNAEIVLTLGIGAQYHLPWVAGSRQYSTVFRTLFTALPDDGSAATVEVRGNVAETAQIDYGVFAIHKIASAA